MLKQISLLFFLIAIASTSVLNISQAVPLSLVLSGCYLGVNVFQKNRHIKEINYVIPFCTMFFIILSTLCNSQNIVSLKPLNHIFSFVICFFIYYPCAILIIKKYGLGKVASTTKMVFHICFVVTAIEFISVNYMDGNVLGFLPRPPSEFEYEPLAYTFVRARGFAEESGHWALISMLLFSISLMSQTKNDNKKNRLIEQLLMVAELILIVFFTFSISGLIVLLVSGLVAPLLSSSRPAFKLGMLFFYILLFLFLTFLLDYYLHMTFVDVFFNKFNGVSGVERTGKISEPLQMIFNGGLITVLFGLGPAFYDTYHLNTVVSFLFLVFFQFGLIGVVLMTMLMLAFFYQSIKTKSPALLFGSIALLIYSVAISNYWFQVIWFYVAVVIFFAERKKTKEVDF